MCEHKYYWKELRVNMALLVPPDERTNILACQAFLERQKEKKRQRRVALGLPPEAPLPADEDEDEGEEEDEKASGEDGA